MKKISILLCSLLFTYAHSEDKLPVIKIFKEGDLPPVLIHGERPDVIENKNVTPVAIPEIKKVEQSVSVEKKTAPVIEHKKVIVHHKHKHVIIPVKTPATELVHEEKLMPIEEKHESVVYDLKSMDSFGEFQLPQKILVINDVKDDINIQLIQKIKWVSIGFSLFVLCLLSLKRTKIIKPEWFFYVSRNNLKALKRKKELEGLL